MTEKYPIKYKNTTISIEKARVLLKLNLGIVLSRKLSLADEIEETQKMIDAHPEIDADFYYVRDKHDMLVAVSYISGIRSIVPELIVQEGRCGGWNVYLKHSDGYLEWRKSFRTQEEAHQYVTNTRR